MVGEQFVYLSPQLPTGQHILRLRVTGERNAASTGTTVSIDRAEIYRAASSPDPRSPPGRRSSLVNNLDAQALGEGRSTGGTDFGAR
jgi:hypothetical protein